MSSSDLASTFEVSQNNKWGVIPGLSGPSLARKGVTCGYAKNIQRESHNLEAQSSTSRSLVPSGEVVVVDILDDRNMLTAKRFNGFRLGFDSLKSGKYSGSNQTNGSWNVNITVGSHATGRECGGCEQLCNPG